MSSRSEPQRPPPAWPARWATAFGRFWWDFLIGDTPELFVGALVILGLVALAIHERVPNGLLVAGLPVATGVVLAISLRRALRQHRR